MQCDLVYGILNCALPEDTVDVDLKVCTLKGNHMLRNDYKSQKKNVALGELRSGLTHH